MHDPYVIQRAVELGQQVKSLQQDLQSPLPSAAPAAEKLPVSDAQELKRAIDDFRLFLWAYIDTWSQNRGDTGKTLQRIRLQAAADMLTVLRTELAGNGLPDSAEGRAIRRAVMDFSQTML